MPSSDIKLVVSIRNEHEFGRVKRDTKITLWTLKFNGQWKWRRASGHSVSIYGYDYSFIMCFDCFAVVYCRAFYYTPVAFMFWFVCLFICIFSTFYVFCHLFLIQFCLFSSNSICFVLFCSLLSIWSLFPILIVIHIIEFQCCVWSLSIWIETRQLLSRNRLDKGGQ